MLIGPLSSMPACEERVQAAFSRLSDFVRGMRRHGLAATECSRLNLYASRMMLGYENIRNIYEYRTPRSLRAFSDFSILLLPILYGPYFAYQAVQFSRDLFFVMPILLALILVGLANMQDQLENPFDQIGPDDIVIDPEHFVASLHPASQA